MNVDELDSGMTSEVRHPTAHVDNCLVADCEGAPANRPFVPPLHVDNFFYPHMSLSVLSSSHSGPLPIASCTRVRAPLEV